MSTDFRLAIRTLARHRGLAVLAVCTLAIGSAATTAIFSAVDAVLIRPQPFRDQHRLVVMWENDVRRDAPLIELSFRDYADWRAQATRVADMAAVTAANLRANLTGAGEPVQIEAAVVSGNFFSVLGVRPLVGRDFAVADDADGAPLTVLIGETIWRRLFGADSQVVGRAIVLDGTPATVIGVMPADVLPRGVEVWMPMAGLAKDAPDLGVLKVIGRLAPGATEEEARAELEVIAAGLAKARPETNDGLGAVLVPFATQVYGPTRPALYLLLGAVALLMLVACANVANLLLARAVDRRHEIAVQAALGAGRGRIARQLFVESLMLAGAAGVSGLVLAAWAVDVLRAMIPVDVPGVARIAVDLRVAAFAIALSATASVLFGLLPALRGARVDAGDAVRDARSSDSARVGRVRGALVIGQVALSLALVAGAMLVGRSFARLADLEPGFDPRRLLTARIQLGDKYGGHAARAAFLAPLLERLHAVPGIESAALVLLRPLADPIGWEWPFTLEGQHAGEHARNPLANFEAISGGYFATMGIPLVEGRTFTDADTADTPPVAVISQSMAERYWPGRSAVGRRIKSGAPDSTSPWKVIVGVVGDVRYREWTTVRYDLYVPFRQWSFGRMDLVMKTHGDPRTVVGAVRRTVFTQDPELPLADVTTMDEAIAEATAAPRFVAVLLGGFSGIALALAAVGVYGVTAWSVRRRQREIGVRVALGATGPSILTLILGRALALVAAGLVVGAGLALAGGRLTSSLLFEIGPSDPLSLTATAVLVAATAALAATLAARRAVHIEPARALRQD